MENKGLAVWPGLGREVSEEVGLRCPSARKGHRCAQAGGAERPGKFKEGRPFPNAGVSYGPSACPRQIHGLKP